MFDVSDTHSPSGEEIELWQMQEDYAWDVKAALEQRFGRLQGARDLPQVLRAVAKRAAEQNVAEYAAELAPYAGNGEQWEFEQTVAASVEYMLLNRCDYLLPELTLPEQPQLGRYGRMRKEYLRNYRRAYYTTLLVSGKLLSHLQEVESRAREQEQRLTEQMARRAGLSEEVKASDQMMWVGEMNSIRQAAREQVMSEIIYN